ncbi:MAG: efflux RND transporter permease subunit, partial [Clostridiales bacterium]|nr:efflux RND transporter permease subunit [Clostridiales bacterium]
MFAKFSVKRPHMIIVAIILVVILGYLSFTNTGVDFLPNINLPYIVVATIYPGGESPDAVEQKVTAPLEQALATANNIKNISTESYPMISLIILELKSGTNVDAVLVEINEKIKTFKTISFGAGLLDSAADAGSGSSLTDEYSGITDLINNILDPIVMTLNPSMLPIMKLSLRQEGKTIGESSEYLKSVAQKLESIDGVASVDVTGLVESMYFVNVDNGKLIKSVLSSFIDFDGLFNGLYDMLLAVAESGASGALSDDATDILNGVKAAAAYASSEVKNVVSQIYDYAGYIPLNIINSVFDGIYAETDRVFDDLQSVYAGDVLMLAVVDAAKQGIIAAVDGAKRRFISYAEGLEQSSLDVVDDIEKNFSEALDGVIDWVKENLPGINDAIAPEAEFLREYLKNPQVRREFELLFKDGLDNMLDYIGTGLGDVIGADLLELAIFANNLEMPVGAIGGTLITVGDRIKTAEELYGLPVATINVVDMIISGITGLHLYDLEALSKQNAAALIFADGLLSAVTNPAATSSSILSAIFQDLDKAGLSTDTVLGLLGLAGIDKGFLENLENMGNSLGENGISLSALIEANQAFGEAIGDLSELNILLKLDDICNIAKIDNTSLLHTILNGSAGVQFNINKNPSSSTAEVSEAVRKALDDLTKNDPSLKYAILDDQGDYIQLVIDTILNNLLIGGLLAILILLVFLKKIGPTAVVGMSIIFSIVLTFIMMWAVGINLNIASMAGLALGVGMLVDNSIIVIENIFSLKSRGKGIFEAAIEGTNKVTGAVIASTVTTLVVFVPLFFTSGMITDIFKDLALTMSFSILSSLIVALTFVPMAATTFIKNVDKVSPLQEKVFAKFFEITTAVKKKSKLLAYVTSPFVVLANLFIKETSERDGKLFNIIKNGYGKLLQLCLKKK